MRKLAVVLLCCFIVVSCKKNEPAEIVVEHPDGTTSPLPPPETATPATTASVATAATEPPPPTTTTPTTTTASTATTGSVATKVSNDAPWGKPPVETSQPPGPEPDIIVDTIYDWPPALFDEIKKKSPDFQYFDKRYAQKWEERRQRQGWRVIAKIRVPGSPNSDPNVRNYFTDFTRFMILYRKN